MLAEKRYPAQAGTTGAIRLRVGETCSCCASPWRAGGMWLPNEWWTSLSRCGGWPMKLTQRPRRSGWCWTTSTPTNQLPSTKPSSPRRLGERKRLEFHYTPKHGSWLNMAEIEFSVLARRVLRRRIADEETLSGEIAALEAERNQAGATIDWRFSTVSQASPSLSCQQLG